MSSRFAATRGARHAVRALSPSTVVLLGAPHPLVTSRVKRLIDILSGLLLLGLLVVLLPVIATIIKLDSRGPVFHVQQRVGLNGRTFRMYKLRSMACTAESDGQACWAVPGDPRVTRLGRLLRASHLDEIPQALNLLRGEMSLVGPRPERPEIVLELMQHFAHFEQRHTVRPGLTGQAQVRHRYTSSVADWTGKLSHDLEYVRAGCLSTDLRIIGCTVTQVLWLKGI